MPTVLSILDPEDPADAAVLDLAEQLIAKHHTLLAEAVIRYIWRSSVAGDWRSQGEKTKVKPWASKGRLILGKAKKASDLERVLAGGQLDFVITLNWDAWLRLDDHRRHALLDHELSHCSADVDEDSGELAYKVVDHDFHEFRSILDRYGPWTIDLELMVDDLKKSGAALAEASPA